MGAGISFTYMTRTEAFGSAGRAKLLSNISMVLLMEMRAAWNGCLDRCNGLSCVPKRLCLGCTTYPCDAIGDKASGMDDALFEIVVGRLEKYPLADEAINLLLAAFESEESLLVQLSGEAAARPSTDMAGVAPPEPAGAYLQSLTVNGFRGIGEPATLRL
jgi:hypothetical protein